MSEALRSAVIPGFMPGIQGATGPVRCGVGLPVPAGVCGPLDRGDKPRDDTRSKRPRATEGAVAP